MFPFFIQKLHVQKVFYTYLEVIVTQLYIYCQFQQAIDSFPISTILKSEIP